MDLGRWLCVTFRAVTVNRLFAIWDKAALQDNSFPLNGRGHEAENIPVVVLDYGNVAEFYHTTRAVIRARIGL